MSQEKLPSDVANQVFTTAELSNRYSIPLQLIEKMMNEGWLPYIKYSQKTKIIPIKAIEAFEDELGRATARKLIKEDEES